MNYSPQFKKLIEDKEQQECLTKGSQVVGADFEKGVDFENWRHMREFIANAINRDGNILNIGCANGFLLRCLQEWSSHKLIPYGIDKDSELIKQAKDLFPLYRNNFKVMYVQQIENLATIKFPNKFNFIYWNVWDNWEFIEASETKTLGRVLEATSDNGRLILGFYDEDKHRIIKKINRLRKLKFKITGIMQNPDIRGEDEIIAWIDKSENQKCLNQQKDNRNVIRTSTS